MTRLRTVWHRGRLLASSLRHSDHDNAGELGVWYNQDPPKHLVALHETESSVLDLLDAVIADNFVQVLGLAINTSEHVTSGSEFIVSSIDSFTLSPACRLSNSNVTWTITSHYHVKKNSKAISGEIYVMDENRDVVSSVLGVRFSLVPLDALRRVLGPPAVPESCIESTSKTTAAAALDIIPAARQAVEEEPEGQSENPILGIAQRVRSIVARFTGATAGDISPDLTLAELGIDSLAVVEFADEFHKLFQKHFATDDLPNMSLQTLIDACSTCRVRDNVSECTTDSTAASGDSFDFINKTEVAVGKEMVGYSG